MPSAVYAQLTESDRLRLVDEIGAAAKNLDPELFPQIDTSEAEFLESVDAVHRYFAANATAENGKAWLTYLDLDPVVELVQSNASPLEIARESMDLRFRLIGTAPGLELKAIRRLRDSVEQLIESVRFRDKEKSIESLSRQLESLAERVGEFDGNPSADDFAAVSVLTGVLRSSRQADGLVASLRNTFNRPNVAVLISEPMVQTAVNRDVNRVRPVRDCILGTRIVGNASMNGFLTANLLPGVGAARVNVSMVGKIVSNNIGYNGPVRLRTAGYGDVNVSRTLTVNESGVTLEPTNARAVLRTKILAIEHKLGLVRKIARKRAAQQKPQADRIAVQRMRQQVGAQFASQTNQATEIMPLQALEKIGPFVKRLSLDEPTRLWGSSEQEIYIDSMLRRPDQLSAVVSRPAILEPYDAAVQIHESAIDNVFTPVLAGRTLSEKRLNELLENIGRSVAPDRGQDEEPELPFEIDFARLRPVIFEARGKTLRLGVRGTRFAQGKRELNQAMEITAVYEPAKDDKGVVVLLRKGDVDVSFPGRNRLTVAQAGLKRTIQKKFTNLFPDTILDRPLEVPMDAKLEVIRGRVFRPHLVDADEGWLTIAVR